MITAATPTQRTAGFRAMGTSIQITAVGIDEAELERGLHFAVSFAERWEARFSRFRPESELSRLNAAAGVPTVVSAELLWMLETAATAYHRTGGRFDPTILPQLAAAGYDRDIAEVRRRSAAGDIPPADAPAATPGMAGIWLDRASSTVTLPAGGGLDFGGIAKGAFVDRLALALMQWPGGCVDAGGDLRVWGEPPDGDHWVVGIEHPELPDQEIMVGLVLDERAAAVATSAANRRRWQSGGEPRHHLIDPVTGRSARETIASCTVFAGSAAEADAAAKALYLSAARGEPPMLARAAAGVIVHPGGVPTIIEGEAADACRFISLVADRSPA